MIPHHNPRPRTPAEVQATIKGYKKQIRHFQERIAEADARILDTFYRRPDAPEAPDAPRRRLLYVSGPFSAADNLHGVERNILTASEAALQGWRQGWAVVCPHKNTAGYQHAEDIPYETWIEGDLEILRRCDAICMLPGWEQSRGARIEMALAEEIGLDVLIYRDGEIVDACGAVRGDR